MNIGKRSIWGISALAALLICDAAARSLLSTESTFFSPALADDDDGGDDDGGGGGAAAGGGGGGVNGGGRSGGGIFKYSKKRQKAYKAKKKQRRAARTKQVRQNRAKASRRAALPIAAPNEVILRGLTEEQLAVLETNGFKLRSRIVSRDGKLIVKLLIPPRTSLRRARARAAELAPSAKVDFNHYFRHGYQVQSGEPCKGDACKPFALVGWRAELSSCDGIPDIGIIDTHVDANHPALRNAKVSALRLNGDVMEPSDASHGTGVAALIAGQLGGPAPGMLPQARIVSVDVFGGSTSGDERADAYDIAAAIDALRSTNIRVINLSIAGPDNDVLEAAVEDAAAAGAVLVSAAGNAGPYAPPAYPAAYDQVIAVTAVNDTLAVYRRAGRGKHIDIAAPGVGIKTAGQKNELEIFTGSSFAVPFVTAAVAVQLSRNAGWTVNVSSDALKSAAKDLGKPGNDPVFGAGLLQFSPCT